MKFKRLFQNLFRQKPLEKEVIDIPVIEQQNHTDEPS